MSTNSVGTTTSQTSTGIDYSSAVEASPDEIAEMKAKIEAEDVLQNSIADDLPVRGDVSTASETSTATSSVASAVESAMEEAKEAVEDAQDQILKAVTSNPFLSKLK